MALLLIKGSAAPTSYRGAAARRVFASFVGHEAAAHNCDRPVVQTEHSNGLGRVVVHRGREADRLWEHYTGSVPSRTALYY